MQSISSFALPIIQEAAEEDIGSLKYMPDKEFQALMDKKMGLAMQSVKWCKWETAAEQLKARREVTLTLTDSDPDP